MRIETIEKKIEGLEIKLEKKNATLARMEKKAEKYSEYEFNYVRREIDELTESICVLRDKIEDEEIKAANRNIPVLVEFLNMWRENAKSWYVDRQNCDLRWEMRRAITQAHEDYRNYIDQHPNMYWYNEGYKEYNDECHRLWKVFEEENRKYEYQFKEILAIEGQANNYNRSFEEELDIELQYEWNRKYDALLAKVEKITGKITDCSCLRINEKNEIDGFIIGEKGKAMVTTFSAGGYNIQCFHYRTKVTRY